MTRFQELRKHIALNREWRWLEADSYLALVVWNQLESAPMTHHRIDRIAFVELSTNANTGDLAIHVISWKISDPPYAVSVIDISSPTTILAKTTEYRQAVLCAFCPSRPKDIRSKHDCDHHASHRTNARRHASTSPWRYGPRW